MPENQWGNQHPLTINCWFLSAILQSSVLWTQRGHHLPGTSASPAGVSQMSTDKSSHMKCNSQGVRVSFFILLNFIKCKDVSLLICSNQALCPLLGHSDPRDLRSLCCAVCMEIKYEGLLFNGLKVFLALQKPSIPKSIFIYNIMSNSTGSSFSLPYIFIRGRNSPS